MKSELILCKTQKKKLCDQNLCHIVQSAVLILRLMGFLERLEKFGEIPRLR